jgi:ribonucleoside-diphosphate reductase alpha chain
LYTRRTLSGEFVIVNKHLVRDLVELDLWSDNLKNKIITEKGSIQNIAEIPVEIREIYKTVWELKQREVIDMSADRGKFICQSQSLNLFIKDANAAKLTSAHFHSWRKGLKTGMYYLRTESAVDAIAGLGVDSAALKQSTLSAEQIQSDLVCSLDNPDDCIACSS